VTVYYVSQVMSDGPAANIGLRVGDRILTVCYNFVIVTCTFSGICGDLESDESL